jgi:hypothetical protein
MDRGEAGRSGAPSVLPVAYPDALHCASLVPVECQGFEAYQWPVAHRRRRIHTSQLRSSRPTHASRRSIRCRALRARPSVAELGTDRDFAESVQRVLRTSAIASRSAILITPPRVHGGSRSSAQGPHATPGTPTIRLSWSECPSVRSSLASAEAPARVASRDALARVPTGSDQSSSPAGTEAATPS